MSRSFQHWLTTGTTELGLKSGGVRFFREVSARQGIVDFIAVDSSAQTENICKQLRTVRESEALIIAQLSKNRWSTQAELLSVIDLEQKSLRQSLGRLVRAGIVELNRSEPKLRARLSREWNYPSISIWAFELKLSKWRRALFQALQMRAYADFVITVFPPDRLQVLSSNLDSFSRFGIGVLIYDPIRNSADLNSRARRKKPNAAHYLYALSELGRQWKLSKSSEQVFAGASKIAETTR